MVEKTYNRKADLLVLEEYFEDGYQKAFRWTLKTRIWVHCEQERRRNIFSTIGISALSVLYTMHPTDISPRNLLRHRNEYYFISQVNPVTSVKTEVDTARVDIIDCHTELIEQPTNPITKLVERTRTKILFPAVITEKYLGYQQKEPMVEISKTFVLITPKNIFLEESDIVYLGRNEKEPYVVQVVHILDKYKNEYEVVYRGDR